MASTCPYILLVVTILSFLVSLGCLIGGCYGDSWLVYESPKVRKKGLWRSCEEKIKEVCTKRKDLFDFNERKAVVEDTILVVLIASAIFCGMAFLSVNLLICYKNQIGSWKCSATIACISAILGVIAGFGALGYAEFEFKECWKTADHGWSVLLAYIGASMQLIGAVLAAMLICIVPIRRSGNETVHYVGNANRAYIGDYQMR